MSEINVTKADDSEGIKAELEKEKPLIGCNIWAYIKDLEVRIKKLESG